MIKKTGGEEKVLKVFSNTEAEVIEDNLKKESNEEFLAQLLKDGNTLEFNKKENLN